MNDIVISNNNIVTRLMTHTQGKAALKHGVPGDLTHVAGGEFPHLRGNTVFFHQGFLVGETRFYQNIKKFVVSVTYRKLID